LYARLNRKCTQKIVTCILCQAVTSKAYTESDSFCLPIDNCRKTVIHEFIKDLENYNRHFHESERSKIRNTVIPFFHRFLHNKVSSNVTEKTLLSLKKSTTTFCKNNPDILFTRADKGNVTVALKRDIYISSLEELLNDNNTYVIVKKNPIANIEKKLNSMIKKWFQLEFISKQSYFSMHSTDSILPKAYGLSKIHKENYPFRIIVSSINTALYPLASFLHKIIHTSYLRITDMLKIVLNCIIPFQVNHFKILIP